MSLVDIEFERPTNPVDIVETFAALQDWRFERSGEDEITISVEGRWCAYHVSFSWMEDLEALHLACAFDLKIPAARRGDVIRLLALINEQLWLGHFDLWSEEDVVMYRHGLLLAGGIEPAMSQIEGLLQAALEASERYYQAFQFVVWAGKSASEALESALFETAGEA